MVCVCCVVSQQFRGQVNTATMCNTVLFNFCFDLNLFLRFIWMSTPNIYVRTQQRMVEYCTDDNIPPTHILKSSLRLNWRNWKKRILFWKKKKKEMKNRTMYSRVLVHVFYFDVNAQVIIWWKVNLIQAYNNRPVAGSNFIKTKSCFIFIPIYNIQQFIEIFQWKCEIQTQELIVAVLQGKLCKMQRTPFFLAEPMILITLSNISKVVTLIHRNMQRCESFYVLTKKRAAFWKYNAYANNFVMNKCKYSNAFQPVYCDHVHMFLIVCFRQFPFVLQHVVYAIYFVLNLPTIRTYQNPLRQRHGTFIYPSHMRATFLFCLLFLLSSPISFFSVSRTFESGC